LLGNLPGRGNGPPRPWGHCQVLAGSEYTKPGTTTTTPTLHGPQGQLASSVEEKEALIRETAFPQAPGTDQEIEIPQGSRHDYYYLIKFIVHTEL